MINAPSKLPVLLPAVFSLSLLHGCSGEPRDYSGIALGSTSEPAQGISIDTLWVAGQPDDGQSVVFGEITSVSQDEQGNVYVLDARNQTIWVLSSTGELLSKIGRPGEGPLEFVFPQSIASENGKLYVLDRNRIVKTIDVSSLEEPTLSHSFQIDFSASSMTHCDGSLYFGGVQSHDGSTTVIHEYSTAGEHRRSFGEPLSHESEMVSHTLSADSDVLCMFDRRVVQAFRYSPEVRVYSGANTAIALIPDYIAFPFRETTDPSGRREVRFSRPEDGASRLLSLAMLEDDAIVQTLVISGGTAALRTHKLRSTDEGVDLQPIVIGRIVSRGGFLYGTHDDPDPLLLRLHLTR